MSSTSSITLLKYLKRSLVFTRDTLVFQSVCVVLFAGMGKVVHLAVDDSTYGINSTQLTSFTPQSPNNAVVRKDHFYDVAGNSLAKKNNSLDRNKP